MPKVGGDDYTRWLKEVREFGKAIWNFTGKGNNVDLVFEHPGEGRFPFRCLSSSAAAWWSSAPAPAATT